MSDEEVDAIAAFLGISTQVFLDQYTRLSPDRKHLSLLERPDGGCQWLDDGPPASCRIESVKPEQCRAFPDKWNFPGWEKECGAGYKDN